MSKTVDFNKIYAEGKENIEIVSMVKDRIIFRPVKVVPKESSSILDQEGNPIEKQTWDRWPVRGEIIHVSPDITENYPAIAPGALVFIEDPRAGQGIHINGEMLAMTRVSNILLVYSELAKPKKEKK